jgi:hypothetical protein
MPAAPSIVSRRAVTVALSRRARQCARGQALEGSPHGGGVVGVLVLVDVVAVTGVGTQGQLRGHGVAFGYGDQQPGQVQHGWRRVAGMPQ